MAGSTAPCQVADEARIHPTVRIGRWCVVGPRVQLDAGVVLEDRSVVLGRTRIGAETTIGAGSVIGDHPQDLKYRGGHTWLLVGRRNRIGRNVTIHVGTEGGGWATYVGDDCRFGDGCHVAHDCYLDDEVTLGERVLLAGHIVVGRGAVLERMTGIHHFTRIGRYCRVGPRTPVRRDVPPFTDFYSRDYYSDPPAIRGVHEAGIAAAGLDADVERALRAALTELFDTDAALATQVAALERRGAMIEVVADLCRFCRESLAGRFGRYRERFRNQTPPEAERFLPEDVRRAIAQEQSCQ